MASTTKTSRKGSSETPSRRTATTRSAPSTPPEPPKKKSASGTKPTTAPTPSSSKSRKAPAKQLASPPSTGAPAPKRTAPSSPTAKNVASPSAKPQTSSPSAKPQTASSQTSSPQPTQLTQIAAAQAELAARVLAKRRLIPFTQRINPRYDAGWVHRDIARRLERFSEDVAKGLSPRLMILMPPRHGKSELASRMFPAWHLGHHPDHEIIACSYNVSLAMSFSRKVKEVLHDPAYQSVFSTRLHPDFQANEEWGIAGSRGGYVAAGVGGGITGKGAHILLIDDPLKNAEEADSPDVREKLWDWYGSTAYTRLAPGAGVLVIQTWWHDDDLAGKLQTAMSSDPESDQFELVKYPAIAEHDEYLDTQSDLITYVSHNVDPTTYDPYEQLQAHARAAAQKVDLTGLRFLRGKGGALHPQRYDTKKLHAIKKTIPPRFWAALYQQNPVPDDGAYFTKDHFRLAPLPPLRKANVYVAFDFAISEKKQNDYTVGVVGLQDENDVLLVAEVMRFKSGDGMFIVESILNLCQKWYSPNLILGFEDGQIFRAIESLLKKRMRERKFYPSTQLLKPITDKMARARPLQGRMQQGMVSFADGAQWFDAARAEMLRFPAGVHDDQVDALAWMATMVVGREPPRQQQAKAPKSWKDKLNSMGKATSFMGA